jgi:hypothetical protein
MDELLDDLAQSAGTNRDGPAVVDRQRSPKRDFFRGRSERNELVGRLRRLSVPERGIDRWQAAREVR